MFDFVSREKFDTEHDARVRAEAERDRLKIENMRLLEMVETERAEHAAERTAHRAELTSLWDRFAPLPKDLMLGDNATTAGADLSAMTLEDQLTAERNSPAAGVTQIRDKRLRIAHLEGLIRQRGREEGRPSPGELSPGETARVEASVS